MKFRNKKEYKKFIEIGTIINYYKYKEVPVPEEVIAELEDNKDSSEVMAFLYDKAINISVKSEKPSVRNEVGFRIVHLLRRSNFKKKRS